MISVIVPVYNVEPYLRKCLDSILAQTHRDLEILVIDDGSTDGSGKVCDEYAGKDDRINVFHTENKGLSCARNLGLDEAKGEWIGFVDSDDWIEPDMYEVLLRKAEETGADVVECGCQADYTKKAIKYPAIQKTVIGTEAIEALIKHKIRNQVWNKIWKAQGFTVTKFPEGRDFEDVSTVYKLILNAKVVGIDGIYYHWRQRESSISYSHDNKNLENYWKANKQRYEDLKDTVSSEMETILLRNCAYAISRTWVWNFKSNCSSAVLKEMNLFARENYPLFGFREWSLSLRACFFLSRFRNRAAFTIAYLFNQMYRALRMIFRNNQMYQ